MKKNHQHFFHLTYLPVTFVYLFAACIIRSWFIWTSHFRVGVVSHSSTTLPRSSYIHYHPVLPASKVSNLVQIRKHFVIGQERYFFLEHVKLKPELCYRLDFKHYVGVIDSLNIFPSQPTQF